MFKRLTFSFGLIAGLLLTSACSAAGDANSRQWVAGEDYALIQPAQPTSTGSKVEVVEVFSYACPHCAHFQPYADDLRSKLPANAQFVLVPAIFNAQWEVFARAFYTAQALNLVDKTHQALFDALHRDHMPLTTIDALANFYAGYGANSANFLSTANSFVVDAKMSHGVDQVHAWGIEATPTLVVNGKYRVGAMAERHIGFEEMVKIALYLVDQESKAKVDAGKPAKP
jgi:thiol:disulfide interchange protein DsbA